MVGHYSFSKTFPAGESKATEISMNLPMSAGIIHDVFIDFPAGCMYLTHVKIVRGEFPVFPRQPSAYYAFEGFTLPIADYWELKPLEGHLTLVGYNEDATHDHTIRLAFQVSDPARYFAQETQIELMGEFLDLQRRILGSEELDQQVGEIADQMELEELWSEHETIQLSQSD